MKPNQPPIPNLRQTPNRLSLIALSLLTACTLATAAEDKKAADPAAIKAIEATGGSILPIASGADSYRFTALNAAKEFNDAALEKLAPLASQIISLDIIFNLFKFIVVTNSTNFFYPLSPCLLMKNF
jgi:hypothetical protein